jgi:maltose alpha-D-glucosyltransferase/alpha-amylase
MSRGTVGRRGYQALGLLLLGCGLLTLAGPRTQPLADVRPAQGVDPYVRWLEQRSILYQARGQAASISGSGVQWQHPYALPQPREVVRRASVWLLDWPGAVVARPGQSVFATWASAELWDDLHEIGIEALHTGPVQRAGGIEGRAYTPTLDGWFDPISLELDPQLGTEEEYRRLVKVATERGGLIAGDLVPLHTGTGPDFRLAQRAYRDYPGMYTMVEIARADWPLLPRVAGEWDSALVPKETAVRLTEKGYIPGLINSCDADPDARSWSGWSAIGEVRGADGKTRRWVYLHYFKPSQPTLNWLDPSFAAPRAVGADLVRNVHDLGARVLRFDAVPFLGIEPQPGDPMTVHYQHPLSVTATTYLAFLTRKLGGWSFHELNVPLSELTKFTRHGPDLSYDFFTRTQCVHALLGADAGPLRLAFRFLLDAEVQPLTLIHDLQNHDEITYQLVELDHRKDEVFTVGGAKVTGKELRERILNEMRAKAAGDAAPYNKLYRPEKDGVATTFAGFIAPALGVRDPYHATAEERARIRQGHLLLAAANAMQPGVFSLSSWDLVGALPVPQEEVVKRTVGGDYRWVNRGGVDLTGANPGADSAWGMPPAQALYGPLPAQLKDPDSFAAGLKRLLAARKKYRIAEGELLAVPEPKNPAACLLVMKTPEVTVAITALNFGRSAIEEEIELTAIKGVSAAELNGRQWVDVLGGEGSGKVTDKGRLTLRLPPLTGKTVVIRSSATDNHR